MRLGVRTLSSWSTSAPALHSSETHAADPFDAASESAVHLPCRRSQEFSPASSAVAGERIRLGERGGRFQDQAFGSTARQGVVAVPLPAAVHTRHRLSVGRHSGAEELVDASGMTV